MALRQSPRGARRRSSRLLESETAITYAELRLYEWIEEEKGYREFLIPAAIVNALSEVRVTRQD